MKRVFNHTLHKELWQWLVDNPTKEKGDWPRWEYNRGDVESAANDCFACAACSGICEDCPLMWKYGRCFSEQGVAEYIEWVGGVNEYERAFWAEQIRDLPIKADWDGEII